MQTLSFTVLRGPWWAAEDGPFVDDVTVEEPSDELVRLAHHAHSAGVIDLHDVTDEALVDHGVQTQEEAEATLTEAMGEWVDPILDESGTISEPGHWTGPWAEGNQAIYEETQATLAKGEILTEAVASGGEVE